MDGGPEPPGGGPPLDPFGTRDPYWERHYGISWLRRVARSQRTSEDDERPRKRPGEALSFFVIALVGIVLIAGVLYGLVFALGWLVDLAT